MRTRNARSGDLHRERWLVMFMSRMETVWNTWTWTSSHAADDAKDASCAAPAPAAFDSASGRARVPASVKRSTMVRSMPSSQKTLKAGGAG